MNNLYYCVCFLEEKEQDKLLPSISNPIISWFNTFTSQMSA